MPSDEIHNKYPGAPAHILDGIWDYAQNHRLHGGFVMAVLENNLNEALGQADSSSLAGLRDICAYVTWEIPATCHGSKEKVQAWLSEILHPPEGDDRPPLDEVDPS